MQSDSVEEEHRKLTLLIVSDEGLGQSLSDGVDLSDPTASLDTDPHVNISEPVLAQELDRLGELVLEGLGLNLKHVDNAST